MNTDYRSPFKTKFYEGHRGVQIKSLMVLEKVKNICYKMRNERIPENLLRTLDVPPV